MTSPAIKLTQECGASMHLDGAAYMREDVIERFYALAQAQALWNAAENVTLIAPELQADDRYYFREQLRRVADNLVRKA